MAYTLEQNGFVERKHRHLIESTRTLLRSQFPLSVLVRSSPNNPLYLINRMPFSVTKNKSPFQVLFHKKPVYHHLRVFGCTCFPWITPSTRYKLQPKTTTCIFIGYSTLQKGYRCLNPITNKIITSRVYFDEQSFSF